MRVVVVPAQETWQLWVCEEDRRLAYVTFTRARDMFIATVARKRPKGNRQPSRFLNEIGLNGDIIF